MLSPWQAENLKTGTWNWSSIRLNVFLACFFLSFMSYKLIQSTFGFKFLPPTSGDQNTNLRFIRQPAAPEPQPPLLFNTAGRRQVGKCPNLQLSTTDVMITINYTARQTEQPLSQSLHPLICLSSSAPFLIPIPPLHPAIPGSSIPKIMEARK